MKRRLPLSRPGTTMERGRRGRRSDRAHSDEERRQSTQQALSESNRRLRLLSQLAEQLLAAKAPVDAASTAFRMIAGELDLHAYFNYLVEPDGTLRLDSWSGISGHVARLISRLKRGEAVCGLVAQRQEPIHATRIQSSAEARVELLRRFGLRAYYCHPLLIDGRLLGTLSFGSKSRDRFSEEELHFIQTVVRYVALADERLRAERNLRESEKEREMYIHTISHDLRTPLTVIHGYLELLNFVCEDPESRVHVEAALKGAERMDAMIQELVEAARLEGKEIQLQKESIRLDRFVSDFLQRSSTALDISRIVIEIPRDLPPVAADPYRLERILTNLLTNALKYSPPGSPVEVRAKPGGNSVEVSVHDHGQGIAPEDLPHIFERFYRPKGGRKAESVGLGLYIARSLVEAHGGRIRVESTQGVGSEFFFNLPLSAPS